VSYFDNGLSPCRHTCQLDTNDEYCLVCGRTTIEIGEWRTYDNDKRKAVMKELKQRRNKLNGLGTFN